MRKVELVVLWFAIITALPTLVSAVYFYRDIVKEAHWVVPLVLVALSSSVLTVAAMVCVRRLSASGQAKRLFWFLRPGLGTSGRPFHVIAYMCTAIGDDAPKPRYQCGRNGVHVLAPWTELFPEEGSGTLVESRAFAYVEPSSGRYTTMAPDIRFVSRDGIEYSRDAKEWHESRSAQDAFVRYVRMSGVGQSEALSLHRPTVTALPDWFLLCRGYVHQNGGAVINHPIPMMRMSALSELRLVFEGRSEWWRRGAVVATFHLKDDTTPDHPVTGEDWIVCRFTNEGGAAYLERASWERVRGMEEKGVIFVIHIDFLLGMDEDVAWDIEVRRMSDHDSEVSEGLVSLYFR